jgi:hypothetical protein
MPAKEEATADEELISRLFQLAHSESKARKEVTRWMKGPDYMGPEPHQTHEWEAASRLQSLLAEKAELQRELEVCEGTLRNSGNLAKYLNEELLKERAEKAELRERAVEECAQVCEREAIAFRSDDYATHQPYSSHHERFACKTCADAIRALAKSPPGATVTEHAARRLALLFRRVEEMRRVLLQIKKQGELACVSVDDGYTGGKKPASKDVWQFPRHLLTDIDAALTAPNETEAG